MIVEPDPTRALDLWISSGVKVTIARFFRLNPGVVDTLAGLSRRLAIPEEVLRAELADNVELGVIRARPARSGMVYMLDRARRSEIEDSIIRRAEGARR